MRNTGSGATKLRNWFSGQTRVAVALSGGVDSLLLTWMAHSVLGKNAWAMHGLSSSVPEGDTLEIKRFCSAHSIQLLCFATYEIEREQYRANPSNRCYFCKDELFSRIKSEIARMQKTCQKEISTLPGSIEPWTIVEGTNTDDLSGHRPGHRAALEQGIRSPYLELGMGKKEIRETAKELSLPFWDKPAGACLASRFPTGTSISEERLKIIAACEIYLHKKGFRNFRVRWHHPIARLELDKAGMDRLLGDAELRHELDAYIRSKGFSFVAVDLREFVSGSMSATLAEASPAREV